MREDSLRDAWFDDDTCLDNPVSELCDGTSWGKTPHACRLVRHAQLDRCKGLNNAVFALWDQNELPRQDSVEQTKAATCVQITQRVWDFP